MVHVRTQNLPVPLIINSKERSLDVSKKTCFMTAAKHASLSYTKQSSDNTSSQINALMIKPFQDLSVLIWLRNSLVLICKRMARQLENNAVLHANINLSESLDSDILNTILQTRNLFETFEII